MVGEVGGAIVKYGLLFGIEAGAGVGGGADGRPFGGQVIAV